jgi:hypothetical protein
MFKVNQVSISPTFYVQRIRKFCKQLFCTDMLGLYFLAQEYGRKAARNMLVKLTTVNVMDGRRIQKSKRL